MMEESISPINLNELLSNPHFPKYYMNGFVVGNGNSDGFLLVQTNSIPTTMINMSFTTMKTLAKSLNDIISTIEDGVQTQVPTTAEIDSLIRSKQ